MKTEYTSDPEESLSHIKEEALLEFLEQERPIILNWENKVDSNQVYIIEVDQLQGYTTFQATFTLTEFDYKVLEECSNGLECFFVFKGQKFLFEFGLDPKKLMVDNGKISVFDMPLSQKPTILRFIQINND